MTIEAILLKCNVIFLLFILHFNLIYNSAINMNQYAVDLNYQAQELWQRIIYFDEFSEKYIVALDTKALTNWNNESTIIKVCMVLCSFTARKYCQI